MMTITEKVAYLKGLAEGTRLDESTNDGKLLTAIIDVLDDMALSIADVEDSMCEMGQQIDEIDDDLAAIEEEWYEMLDDDDDEDEYLDSDVIYEIECPTCGDVICLDEDLASDEEVDCPSCGEHLEFDISEAEESSGCDCGDDCTCSEEGGCGCGGHHH